MREELPNGGVENFMLRNLISVMGLRGDQSMEVVMLNLANFLVRPIHHRYLVDNFMCLFFQICNSKSR